MSDAFHSNEEVFEFARQLRDKLAAAKRAPAAAELTEVVDGAWSTASEALGEMLRSLHSVREEVHRALPQEIERLDAAAKAIELAFEQANNPNT